MSSSEIPSVDPTIPVEPELPPHSVTQPMLDLAEPSTVSGNAKQPYARLFLISFFILFFELVCIRWFGSTVVFLTFFTNIVLIACFLGMSVGLLCAGRKTNFITWVLPLTAVACVLSAALLYIYQTHDDWLMIDVGNQKSPAAIYFGTEYRAKDLAKVVIPMPVIGGTFFVLISLMFIGLGQEMGRAFDAIGSRVKAYSVDILGSLFGIAFFSALSYAWTSPLVWFIFIVLLMLYFLKTYSQLQTVCLAIVLAVAGYTSYSGGIGTSVMWSPYYKVAYDGRGRSIDTNNIAHQHMADFDVSTEIYPLPHALNRDAGQPPFERVMIIGAGSGNDVQAALMGGAKQIDAIEIDPVIQGIGRSDHPNWPYRTREYFYDTPEGRKHTSYQVHIEDGRQWLKKPFAQADAKTPTTLPTSFGLSGDAGKAGPYDYVAYALVDSLVLHSSYSSVRLESFLFTEEAFRDVKANLKPGGVFVMYNFYRQPWVVGRLNAMAEKVFGVKPVVFSLPSEDEITDKSSTLGNITFLLTGVPDKDGKNTRIEAIRSKLNETKSYWLSTSDVLAKGINGYSVEEPALPTTRPEQVAGKLVNRWFHVKPATVNVPGIDPNKLPSDDWPQLYLKERKLPPETLQSMIVIGALSVLILLIFMPKGRGTGLPNGRMFFLGAGFMLLETKGVVHMSLLLGSTWITNSVVFFAILVMILIANLYVLAVKPQKLWPYYLLLIVALVVNALVPMNWFLGHELVMRMVLSCCVIFVPVFFAGVIFATSFRDAKHPDTAFGWNIAGVILGALAENFSVVVGFNYLIFVAVAFYLLSMPWVRRTPVTPVPALA